MSEWAEAAAARIRAALPGADVEVGDPTGTGAHLEARVEARQFEGKPLVEQHRLVTEALQEELTGGRLHTLALRLAAPIAEGEPHGA